MHLVENNDSSDILKQKPFSTSFLWLYFQEYCCIYGCGLPLRIFLYSSINFFFQCYRNLYHAQSLRFERFTSFYNVFVIVVCNFCYSLVLLRCVTNYIYRFGFYEWVEFLKLHLYSLQIAVARKAMWVIIKFNERTIQPVDIDIQNGNKNVTLPLLFFFSLSSSLNPMVFVNKMTFPLSRHPDATYLYKFI